MTDDRITKKAPYGQHIPLVCKNHPSSRWSTKNILYIGARTIFHVQGLDCSCPVSDLQIAIPEDVSDVPE